MADQQQLIPVAHWVYINMDNHEEVSLFLHKVLLMYACIAVGFFFYASLVPESLFPGRFDIVGHSHQWWHVFSLAAFVWWFYCGLQLREYRYITPCAEVAQDTPKL